jgi:tRNA-uridine 2-sulfurtransferase
MCNRYVKFDAFWKWAKEQGADFIATGHYAQVTGHSRPRSLYAGVDKNKDQSYFLWTLNQNDLEHVLFPIGHLKKSTVREIARKNNLPNADKRDSQGLCFIGKVDLKDFLSRYIKAADGNVLDEKGEKIGRHPGATLFTIGERHGFTITDKTPNDSPYFVIDKDIEQNTITVSNKNRERPLLGATNIATITRVNWVSGAIPSFGDDIAKTANNSSSDNDNTHYPLQVRGRYREPLQKARIKKITFSEVTIEFQKIQETLSPGQSLVIYNGEECLGGGIIE